MEVFSRTLISLSRNRSSAINCSVRSAPGCPPELEPPPESEVQTLARAERAREQGGGSVAPPRVVTALGVDRETEELWVSAGTLLVHFDKDGNHLASYRTYTPNGGRLAVTAILVESDRLLLGADPFGLYEFARPDKIAH